MNTRTIAAQKGFTLIEGMVTTCILATTLGLAAPQFQGFTANQSLRATSFEMTTDLVLARSEAVKRNTSVRVAQLDGDWKNGWVVLQVSNGSILKQSRPMSDRVTAQSATADPLPASITFDRNGRPVGGALVQLELKRSMGSTAMYRCVSLDPAGLPRIGSGEC